MTKTATVDDFMARLEHPLKAEIEILRAAVLRADDRIKESIKWNAPSFYVSEHFATFKLRPPGTVQLVFHRGAKVRADDVSANIASADLEDPAGILIWAANDRCVATFSDLKDVEAKKVALTAIVRAWIDFAEKASSRREDAA